MLVTTLENQISFFKWPRMTEDDCPPRGRLTRINEPSAALKSYLRLNKGALFAQEVLPYLKHLGMCRPKG